MQNYEKQRSQMVVISNVIAQRSRTDLSLKTLKTLMYIISMIKPDDNKLEYTFDIGEYIKTCGSSDAGKNYTDIKSSLLDLKKDSWWVENDDTETLVSWINKALIHKKDGKVQIRLDEDLKPYLLALGKNFTAFELYNILALTSNYAIQLYIILKSFAWQHQWIISVDEFKRKFMLNNLKSYEKWGQVKRRVIELAVNQINEKTDLTVMYKDDGKRGVKATQIAFVINKKNNDCILETKNKINNELNEQIGLEPNEELFDWINKNKPYSNENGDKEKEIEKEQILQKYKQQIEYTELIKNNDKNTIDEILVIISEIELSKTPSFKINGEDKLRDMVVLTYKQLKKEHMEYVLQSISENQQKVKNIRSYIITVLYNAVYTYEMWKEANRVNLNKGNKGSFCNYEQRTYDFEELERQLLGWDNIE